VDTLTLNSSGGITTSGALSVGARLTVTDSLAVDTIDAQSGDTVTVDDNLTVTGGLILDGALSLASGGSISIDSKEILTLDGAALKLGIGATEVVISKPLTVNGGLSLAAGHSFSIGSKIILSVSSDVTTIGSDTASVLLTNDVVVSGSLSSVSIEDSIIGGTTPAAGTFSSLSLEGGYSLPTVDGASGEVLFTDGSGAVSWGAITTLSSHVDGLSVAYTGEMKAGSAWVTGTLDVDGALSLDVDSGTALQVSAPSGSHGIHITQGTFNCEDAATIGGGLSVSNGLDVSGVLTGDSADLSGEVKANTLLVETSAVINGGLTLANRSSGTVLSIGAATSGNDAISISTGAFRVLDASYLSDVSLTGTLSVTGLSTLSGGLDLSGGTPLVVSASTSSDVAVEVATGGLTVAGATTLDNTLTVTSGNTTSLSTLSVSGVTTFSNNVNCTGHTITVKNLTVLSSTTFGDDITLSSGADLILKNGDDSSFWRISADTTSGQLLFYYGSTLKAYISSTSSAGVIAIE
ncbi:hypothetical protein KIPB_010280, partial [Kipferlia bialata]